MPPKLNIPRAVKVKSASVVLRLCKGVIVDPDSGCWIWQGCKDQKGYGQIKVDGKACWVHRIAYAAFKGPIPRGMQIDHKCGCTSCINPDCLEVVTNQENTRRRDARRRAAAKLNESDVPF
ncbi:MAG: HNH endonuclease signature motif containing protein [Planctomycetota bacterium]